MLFRKAFEVSVQNVQKASETVSGLSISPPSAFAPVFSPLWGTAGCRLLPTGGDSVSVANNVSHWTLGPFCAVPLTQSPVQSSAPLGGSLAVNESSPKSPATERAFSTFFSFPLRFLFLTPGSILTQYRETNSSERIYKRWSNLQTSSKLHRVMSSHFSVHFCTFHPGQWI